MHENCNLFLFLIEIKVKVHITAATANGPQCCCACFRPLRRWEITVDFSSESEYWISRKWTQTELAAVKYTSTEINNMHRTRHILQIPRTCIWRRCGRCGVSWHRYQNEQFVFCFVCIFPDSPAVVCSFQAYHITFLSTAWHRHKVAIH